MSMGRDDIRKMRENAKRGDVEMRRKTEQKEVVELTPDKKFAKVKIIQEPDGRAEIGYLTQTPERVRRIIDFMTRVENGEMKDLRINFGKMDRDEDLWVFPRKKTGNMIGTYKEKTTEIPATWDDFKKKMQAIADQMPG